MRIRTLAAAGALALAVGVTPALADHENQPPGTRGQGAPGKVCQSPPENHEPGTQAFRECVTRLAKERGHGQNGQNQNAARREAREALRAAIAACRQHTDRATRRACVQQARQTAKAQRQQRRAALRAAIATCRQQNPTDRQARRACIRQAKADARAGR